MLTRKWFSTAIREYRLPPAKMRIADGMDFHKRLESEGEGAKLSLLISHIKTTEKLEKLKQDRTSLMGTRMQNSWEAGMEVGSVILCAAAGALSASLHFGFLSLFGIAILLNRKATASIRKRQNAQLEIGKLSEEIREITQNLQSIESELYSDSRSPPSMLYSPMSHNLLERAAAFLDEYPPNLISAKKLYLKALNQYSHEIAVLDSAGSFFFEYDDPTLAIECFRKSVETAPLENPRKYFCLGQLLQGFEAEQMFRRGLQLGATASERISALCSIAELYMTDLCDEANAQSCCEVVLREALGVDEKNLEAINGSITFFKVIGKIAEAKELAKQGISAIGECTEENLAAFPVRLNFAKNLIDLEESQDALDVLHDLLDEDEEDIEVWFLVACAHLVAEDMENASETINHAKNLCQRNKEKLRWWDELSKLEFQILDK